MSSKVKQWIATVTADIGSFGLGMALGWTSPALPAISDCENTGKCDILDEQGMTLEEASWVGALLPLGCLLGGYFAGPIMERFGRKWSMVGMAVPSTIGWILIMITKFLDSYNLAWFLIGRVLIGFGGGTFLVLIPIFVSEIADISIRGTLGSTLQLSITMGMALVNAFNIQGALSWNTITIICSVFPALMALGMLFIPESPYYLVTKNKTEEARVALKWFSSGDAGDDYLDSRIKEMREAHRTQSEIRKTFHARDLYTKPLYLKPFAIILGLMFFQQFSGINGVLFYLTKIFLDAGTDMDPGLSAFIVAIVQVIATGIAVVFVERSGRRILLLLSAVIQTVSITGLGIFFYLEENKTCGAKESGCSDDGFIDEETVKSLSWLPLVSLIVYIFGFSIGFGPLPWIINAEISSQEARPQAAPIAAATNWFFAFIVSKFQSNIIEVINASGAYFVYGGIILASIVFIYMVVPETKGKSPEEMKRYFDKPRSSSSVLYEVKT